MTNQQFVALSVLAVSWFIIGLMLPTPRSDSARTMLFVSAVACATLGVILFTGAK